MGSEQHNMELAMGPIKKYKKPEDTVPNLQSESRNHAIRNINFSSSFSDDSSLRSKDSKNAYQVGDESSRLSDFDKDDLIILLNAASNIPRKPAGPEEVESDNLKGKRSAHDIPLKSSPLKIDLVNIIDTSSPKKKKPKSISCNHSLVQKRNLRTTSSIKKETGNMYPTLQLATQRVQNPGKVDIEKKSVKPIVLSNEQENVLQLAVKGKSLFYTGSAGTGKSILLKAIIKALKSKYENGSVAITASTGLAACNIGGITLHSFAGVGLGEGTVSSLMKKVKRNKKALLRWKRVKVLVIDEISMIDGIFLNKLDEIAKNIRKNNLPFGGIQLIVCGDFYQLPPVNKSKPNEDLNSIINHDIKQEITFAFESRAWSEAISNTIFLREVFRQRGDSTFVDMLNDMRTGKVNENSASEFRKLSRPLQTDDGIEPAELFSTRCEVDYANNFRLSQLEGEAQLYASIDTGSLPMSQRQSILNNFLAPQRLYLKKNAQVMCIKNFDGTLVNGSLGQVVGFMDRNTYMHYTYMKDHPEATAKEIEAEICKKTAREKSSTEEIEGANKKILLNDSIFEFLNEIPDSGVSESFNETAIPAEVFNTNKRRKIELIKDLQMSSKKSQYPLVRFLLPDGISTREVLVEPEQWIVEDENDVILAKRVQLPIILAWSLSIHKSQGQTLPKVKVDLKNVFEKGQAYVALSRAVSREGLQVLNFNRSKIIAHPKVEHFYKSLSSIDEIGSKTMIPSSPLDFGSTFTRT